MDHRCYVNGKEVVHKAGSTIAVTDAVYKQISIAVQKTRAQKREYFEKQVGSPEWKALQK
jgi:hypothetical protein